MVSSLASFGGAGGQHACEIAHILGISTVLIHRYSSILSAYGLALADRQVPPYPRRSVNVNTVYATVYTAGVPVFDCVSAVSAVDRMIVP